MMKLIGMLFLASLITLYEYPKMKKKKMKKDINVFFVFLSVSISACLMYIYEVNIPNPLRWIEFALSPVGKFILGS